MTRWVVLPLMLLLGCAALSRAAAPTFDAVTTANQVQSFSHTLGGTANLAILCIAQQAASVGLASNATVGGQAMTEVTGARGISPDGNQRMQIFYRLAPPTGAQTFAFTDGSGGPWLAVAAISVIGAKQSAPPQSANAGADSSAPSVTVSSATDNLVLDCGMTGGPALSDPTEGGGQTQRFFHTHNDAINHWGSTEAGASPNVTMSWTIAAAHQWAEGAITIEPLVVASARRRLLNVYP